MLRPASGSGSGFEVVAVAPVVGFVALDVGTIDPSFGSGRSMAVVPFWRFGLFEPTKKFI